MIHNSFSLLSPSIPILLISVNNQTAEVQDIIKKVSREPFRVLSWNHKELTDECSELNIPCPKELWAQFFPCSSLADYNFLSSRFVSEKSLYFYQYTSVIVFVDFSLSDDFESIKEEYLNIINKAFPIGFFIYQAKESDVDLANETTCLFFENYSKDKVHYHLRQFGINFVLKSILQNTIFASKTKLPNKMKVFPIRVSLLCVSADFNEILTFFKNEVKKLMKIEKKEDLAPFFEICAFLDRFFPDFIQSLQISDFFSIGKAPWVTDESDLTNDISKCLSVSGYLYYSNNFYIKAIDCGLRCVSYGFDSFLYPTISLIQTFSKEPLMKYSAIESILLCSNINLPRKAALFAYEFSQSLPESEKIDFTKYCLEIIQNYSKVNNAKIQYEVVIPLIMILKDTNAKLCSEITSDILSQYGCRLPYTFQKQLFQNLSSFSSSKICLDCKLNLHLCSVEIEKPSCFARPKMSSKKSVFIYNYRENHSAAEFISGINQPIRFLIRIKNNFQVSLPISISFPMSEEYENDEITFNLHPSNPTLVSIVVTPTKTQKYIISSLHCSLYGLNELINFPKPIFVNVIDFPIDFSASTDLPLFRPIDSYIGEIIDFSITINNQGEFPIIAISTFFKKEQNLHIDVSYDKSELPIEPMSIIDLSCQLQIKKAIDLLEFEVCCSSENNDFDFIVAFRQPINVKFGLLPKSIYPIQNPPLIPDFQSATMMLIGVEIENQSTETFSYITKFDTTSKKIKNNGFLGSGKNFVHLFPIVKKELAEQIGSLLPDDLRVIKAAREAELAYGISGSLEERHKIVQLTNLQIYIINHLTFNWETADHFHRGTIPIDSVLPDISFLDEMSKNSPTVKISYFADNEEINEIFTDKIVDVVVDFNGFLVNKCSVDIKKYQNPTSGLIWEGKLIKKNKDGESKFHFRFCFCVAGLFELPIHYCSDNNNVIGTEVAVINVKNDQ